MDFININNLIIKIAPPKINIFFIYTYNASCSDNEKKAFTNVWTDSKLINISKTDVILSNTYKTTFPRLRI